MPNWTRRLSNHAFSWVSRHTDRQTSRRRTDYEQRWWEPAGRLTTRRHASESCMDEFETATRHNPRGEKRNKTQEIALKDFIRDHPYVMSAKFWALLIRPPTLYPQIQTTSSLYSRKSRTVFSRKVEIVDVIYGRPRKINKPKVAPVGKTVLWDRRRWLWRTSRRLPCLHTGKSYLVKVDAVWTTIESNDSGLALYTLHTTHYTPYRSLAKLYKWRTQH